MATGQGGIYTGFIEGLIKQTGGSEIVLPFSDKVGTANFNYSSENVIVETFSSQGIKGASGSCPLREACSIELSSENLAWSFLQAAFNTLAVVGTRVAEQSTSVVLTEVEGTAPNQTSTYTLPFEVSAEVPVVVSDEDGVQYDVTVTVGTGTTSIDFDDDFTNEKVTIFYGLAAGTPTIPDTINLGSGSKLGEIGVYGRFSGCPDNILVAIPRGIIQSNVTMGAGEGAASAAMTITALRDSFGNFAYLKRV
jgi:hypothetical protein